jgi:integrase
MTTFAGGDSAPTVRLATPRRTDRAVRVKRSPRRRSDEAARPREFLTGAEVERLRKAAGGRFGRHAHRDGTMILLAYRHGLRVTEPVALRWDVIDLG